MGDHTPPARSARFGEDAENIAAARAFAVAAAELCEAPVDLTVLALLVGELAANAVCHAATPFQVTVAPTAVHDALGLRVEVIDEDPAAMPHLNPHPGIEGGWGLNVVDRAATAWGARVGTHTKAVWFDLEP